MQPGKLTIVNLDFVMLTLLFYKMQSVIKNRSTLQMRQGRPWFVTFMIYTLSEHSTDCLTIASMAQINGFIFKILRCERMRRIEQSKEELR